MGNIFFFFAFCSGLEISLYDLVGFWSLVLPLFFLPLIYFDFMISVGTNMGDVMLWDLGIRERIAVKNFKVRELGACSMPLQVCFFEHE